MKVTSMASEYTMGGGTNQLDDSAIFDKDGQACNFALHVQEETADAFMTPKPTMKKRVSFDEKVRVRKTMSRKVYTDQERSGTWYSPEEKTRIVTKMCKELKLLEEGKALKDSKYCSRGLELKTKEERTNSIDLVNKCVHAVCQEQSSQSKSGDYDQDKIAQIYSELVSPSRQRARTLGKLDAEYVVAQSL